MLRRLAIKSCLIFLICSACESWNYEPKFLIQSMEGFVNLLANKKDARIVGSINLSQVERISEYGYIYSHSQNPSSDPSSVKVNLYEPSLESPVTIADTIRNLSVDTFYFFQIYAIYDDQIVFGDVLQLATNRILLTTDEIQTINLERTIVKGTVLGLESDAFSLVSHGHCWSSEMTVPIINDTGSDTTDLGPRNNNGIFQSILTNLKEDQTYFIRSYAIYEDSNLGFIEIYSEVESFQIGNIWAENADMDSLGRYGAFGFEINNKAYVGAGFLLILNRNIIKAFTPRNEFLEYDPESKTWDRLGRLDWANRIEAIHFVIGQKAYVGLGYNPLTLEFYSDFQVFVGDEKTWQPFPSTYNGPSRRGAVSFDYKGKGYIGFGRDGSGQALSDLWEFEPSPEGMTGTWTQIPLDKNIPRSDASTFMVNDIVYIGLGVNENNEMLKDLWALDPSTGTLEQVPQTFKGEARSGAISFALGNKGYIGTGINKDNITLIDFWEFNPANNSWRQLPDLPGQIRHKAVGVVIGDDAYVGAGQAKLANIGYEASLNDWFKFIAN